MGVSVCFLALCLEHLCQQEQHGKYYPTAIASDKDILRSEEHPEQEWRDGEVTGWSSLLVLVCFSQQGFPCQNCGVFSILV